MKDFFKNFSEKRERRKQLKIEKSQQKDFERYGLKTTDIKKKSAKTNWKALKSCMRFFKPYKCAFVVMAFLGLVAAGLSVLAPVFTEKNVSSVTNIEFMSAIYFALFMLGAELLRRVVLLIWYLWASRTIHSVIKNIRSELMLNVFKTKSKKFDLINSGEIISRVNGDPAVISGFIQRLIESVAEVLRSLGYVAFFFILNFWIGCLVLLTIITFTLLDNIYQRYRQKMRKKLKTISDKNMGMVSEIVRSIRDVKALNIKDNIGKKYEDNITYMKNASNDNATFSYWFTGGINSLLYVFRFAFIALGVLLLSQNLITVGMFVVFIMYNSNALQLFNNISGIRDEFREASLSAERITEVFDEEDYPKEVFGKRKIKNPKGEIKFENITFEYNENVPVLKDFSLTIPANTRVAFVGKSGHGKSTILSLIPKLYEVNKGKILIDGIDIKKLDENCLRDLVTIVPQTPYIYNTTIRENLQFVKPDLTEEEMISACKVAQIHDFIISKPDGYDSLVGENGVILSGGQKQRIAIARALLKNSKIILLDEATSALDNESQAKIQKALDNLAGTHTIIIVAHRLSTVINADKIVMIENGKIIGEGTHKELLKNCKEYYDLYNQEEIN